MASKIDSIIGKVKGYNVLSADQLYEFESDLRNALPKDVYKVAIYFLGAVTVLLVVGSIVPAMSEKGAPDAIWAALGAGIGGLAGIFMQQS
jgi:hypothetical protein